MLRYSPAHQHHQFQKCNFCPTANSDCFIERFGLAAGDALAPFSVVCKAVAANGRPTVKLSDNPNKAMGPAGEIARYKRVFGVGAQKPMEVVV